MVRSQITLAALAALFTLVTACGSTPARRIEENQALFDGYPADIQASIKSGQIRKGFDQNQVYMALNKPAQKNASASGETWTYTQEDTKRVTTKKDVYKYELERKRWEEAKAKGTEGHEPSMDETVVYFRTRVIRVVEFKQDGVISWSTPSSEFLDEWHLRS